MDDGRLRRSDMKYNYGHEKSEKKSINKSVKQINQLDSCVTSAKSTTIKNRLME